MLSEMARASRILGCRNEDRRLFRQLVSSWGTDCPGTKLVAAANVGTYTRAGQAGFVSSGTGESMRVEVELSPVIATGEMLELARMVDEAGADRLGISDVAMLRDTFLVQARYAEVTRRVQIGSLVSNSYLRHPAVAATTLATLNEISQGRAFLGIGVGAGLSGLGIDQSRPARRLEEFLLVVGRLMSGGQLDWDGPSYRIRGAQIASDIACRIPVVVGTRSRRVATLAGRLADAGGGGRQGDEGRCLGALPQLGSRGGAGGGAGP